VAPLYSQNDGSQLIPKVSLISSNVSYKETIVTKSYNLYRPGNKYSNPVVTYNTIELYSLKITVIIRESNHDAIFPLDIKLTSPENEIKILSVDKDISQYQLNEFYNYELDIDMKGTGWFTIEIGDYLNGQNNITYDKSIIYVKKIDAL
jgi:hypothetical protein